MNNDLINSYEFCKKITQSHYENFPVASLLIPPQKRYHIFSLYAFARIADDIADEGDLSPKEKIKLLMNYKTDFIEKKNIQKYLHFRAVYDTVEKFNLPVSLFIDLVDAFIQDNTKNEYNNFDELLDYCKKSANPVGRIVLLIFGYNGEEIFESSDKICTALQLTNFWQDLSIDLKKNRCYLPLNDMLKFEIDKSRLRRDKDELFNLNTSTKFAELMKFEIERTKKLFAEGEKVLLYLKGLLKLEIKLTILGGRKILSKIENQNYNSLTIRPALNSIDKINLFLSAFK